VGQLLELAQRLGGLGPGWRRSPHVLTRFNGFRGSEFTTTTDYADRSLDDLLNTLNQSICTLAQEHHLRLNRPQALPTGAIHSIWKSDNKTQWEKIVHGVCSTKQRDKIKARDENIPDWWGSTHRPSK
jgi:CRISPR-associated protein Cmr6